MKNLLFVCLLALGIPLSANYDFPCGDCQPYLTNSFEGFYVGGNLGVLSHTAHRTDFDGFVAAGATIKTINNAFLGGLQLGYDFELCNAIIGIVGDWNWSNSNQKNRISPNDPFVENNFIRDELNWISSLRARVGIPFYNALAYLTVGCAGARFDTRWFNASAGDFRQHHTRWGWVGGFGTEFLVSCNWSLGAEFLFFSFQRKTYNFIDDVAASRTFAHNDTAWNARFFVNYRLGNLFRGFR